MLATMSPTQPTTRQAFSVSGLARPENGTSNLLEHITCGFGCDMSLWFFLMTKMTRIHTLDRTRCWSLWNELRRTPVYLPIIYLYLKRKLSKFLFADLA